VTVELRYLSQAAEEGWATLFDLAEVGADSWLLVGGQMMHVLALQHGAERIRPTQDIDVVVNLRVQPNGTEWLANWLQEKGFQLEGVSQDQIGHRFVRPCSTGKGTVAFDVLAPAGVGNRVRMFTVPPARTVPAPGSLQAFVRSSILDVLISDFTNCREKVGGVRCPDLLGALVLKAAATSIPARQNPERDWQDAALLLSVLADPVAASEQLGKRDLDHLRRLGPLFDTAHPGWENLSSDARRQGTAALSFLITRGTA
jgi:hypothetical protein